MLYKSVVLLDLFLYSTFFSFYKKQRKVFFHFFARTKKRNKEMRRLKRRRTAMPHKAANFIHEFINITVFSPNKSLHISDGKISYVL